MIIWIIVENCLKTVGKLSNYFIPTKTIINLFISLWNALNHMLVTQMYIFSFLLPSCTGSHSLFLLSFFSFSPSFHHQTIKFSFLVPFFCEVIYLSKILKCIQYLWQEITNSSCLWETLCVCIYIKCTYICTNTYTHINYI